MSYLTFFTFVIVYYLLSNVCGNSSEHLSDNSTKPLYLTPLIRQGRINEARLSAEVHHDDFYDVKSYSGFFNVDERYNSQMFFWYFPSRRSPDSPLVLWLDGGPGCSGLLGVFYSNGPFKIGSNNSTKKRSVAWNNEYHMLYVDNPVGVGFSHTTDGGYSENETAIATNLYSFLDQFLVLFSELKDNELYVIGESYGAKYAIHLCDKIHNENQNTSIPINLQAIGLFSGWFDPVNQVDYGENLYNIGMIDKHGLAAFVEVEQKAKKIIKEEDLTQLYDSQKNTINPFDGNLFDLHTGNSGMHNMMKPNEKDVSYIIFVIIEKYIENFRTSLHLGSIEMNASVQSALEKIEMDTYKSSAPVLSKLLNHYRVVVASGQLDMIVSYPLLNNVLNNLNFSSSAEWLTAERHQWYLNEQLVGYYKTAGNVTEVLVLNSGHNIAIDQPERAQEIVRRLINNSWN